MKLILHTDTPYKVDFNGWFFSFELEWLCRNATIPSLLRHTRKHCVHHCIVKQHKQLAEEITCARMEMLCSRNFPTLQMQPFRLDFVAWVDWFALSVVEHVKILILGWKYFAFDAKVYISNTGVHQAPQTNFSIPTGKTMYSTILETPQAICYYKSTPLFWSWKTVTLEFLNLLYWKNAGCWTLNED